MPELPEVQTIVSDLDKVLPNLKIVGVWSDWKKTIKNPKNFSQFKKIILGKKIKDVKRRGKNILINLSDNTTLLIHQKMTGHMLYGLFELKQKKWIAKNPGPIKDDPQNRFIHLVFELSNGRQLALSDVRKFAKVLMVKTDELKNLEDLKKIGPEPLEKSFTFKKFKEILKNKKGKIKNILMNQEIIAGIGNIYASEILWDAGVHPLKNIQKIKDNDLKKIYQSTKKILKIAIKMRGDSIIDYRDAFGKKGKYQNFHKAYQQNGEKCSKKDGGIIIRIKDSSRSAFFCPKHQKL
ncbi:MAG: DNA-formamidopyrimidine glycosylase [Candidatus Marinimicrobia bacterium]|nr:DNA-formamidopyrimidine glycosylase [Candidatus Neomarinimicrobiota bacterium]